MRQPKVGGRDEHAHMMLVCARTQDCSSYVIDHVTECLRDRTCSARIHAASQESKGNCGVGKETRRMRAMQCPHICTHARTQQHLARIT